MRSMPDEGRRNLVTSPAPTQADRPNMNPPRTVCNPLEGAPTFLHHKRRDCPDRQRFAPRLVGSFAVHDEVIARLARDQRKRRRLRVRATFLASAHMQHNPIAGAYRRDEFERVLLNGARRIRASRRPGAGNDAEARVRRIENEAAVRQRSSQFFCAAAAEPSDNERPPRGKPDVDSRTAPRFLRQKAKFIGGHATQRGRRADASGRAEAVDAEKISAYGAATQR